jgi:hypothetical protein
MSDKPKYFIATGVVRYGDYTSPQQVVYYEPLPLPDVTNKPVLPDDLETFDIKDFNPQWIPLGEIPAEDMERLLKPIWGYMHIGGQWFSLPEKPVIEDGKLNMNNAVQLDPEVVEMLELDKKYPR